METLGDYLLVKELGAGSLGSVYLAEHRFLKKRYALKILAEDLNADRSFIARFEKEIALLSLLDHPHIVRVHNVSSIDQRFFLVSDCIVDGMGEVTNLQEFLAAKQEPLQEEELVRIARQLAMALDYAHKEGAFHGALKLNNILIGESHDGPNVYLSDFGLAKIVGSGAFLTRTYRALSEVLSNAIALSKLHRSFLQNYAFLAPEQRIGEECKQLDAKTDIYAFGVLIYYLIAQELPEGFFDLSSLCPPHYKLQWGALISQCMHRDPAKRPTSLSDVLEELLSIPKTHKWGNYQLNLQDSQPKPILNPQEILRPEFEPDPSTIFQTESSVIRYQPSPKEERSVEPLLTEMIVIRGGTFVRGSNNGGRDEMHRHAVNLASFAIDVHPVTNEQFVRFIEELGGEKDHNNNDIIRLRESRVKRSAGKLMIESGYAKHPVVGITWYGAVAYAKWVGKRLPTEAEWEIAARGNHEEYLYPTGKNIERTQANFFSSDTTAAMSYPPNDYGLYDMAGNVYQWCQDWYDYHYYDISAQEPDNPKGPLQGVYRVLRGGCWKSLKEDLRCSHRHRNNPGTMNGTYGFRCAADVA